MDKSPNLTIETIKVMYDAYLTKASSDERSVNDILESLILITASSVQGRETYFREAIKILLEEFLGNILSKGSNPPLCFASCSYIVKLCKVLSMKDAVGSLCVDLAIMVSYIILLLH